MKVNEFTNTFGKIDLERQSLIKETQKMVIKHLNTATLKVTGIIPEGKDKVSENSRLEIARNKDDTELSNPESDFREGIRRITSEEPS